jgi:uncharacterized protein (UPF0333 family)
MATPQLSPGVITREVDLTVGRADNVLANVGAIAGPFSIGPVEEAVDIVTEQQLINTFGKPISTDTQYEYWMSASSYLSYGGVLKVVRADGSTLNNGNAGVGAASTTSAKIKNFDDYNSNWADDTVNFTYAAKNPGTWANNLKVCTIDDLADQTIGITTTDLSSMGAVIGYGVTTTLNGTLAGSGTTSNFTGYLKGIITGVTTDSTNGASTIDVKIVSRVSGAGTETAISYAEASPLASFESNSTLYFVNNSGINTGLSASNLGVAGTVTDWYNNQTLGLTNSTIFWKQIAPKPITNQFSATRNSKNDAMHVVVVDDNGSITGVQGNILEKHISISKASDSVSAVNSPQKIFYKNYLANFSEYVYAGRNPSAAEDTYHGTVPTATGFSSGFTPVSAANGLWGQATQGVTFSSVGNVTYTFAGGVDYSASGGMNATLADLVTAYDLFSNKDEISVDFLINGPGLGSEDESQAKANKLISIAESRQDCVAVISPYRASVVDITNTSTQTNNIVKFFAPLTSSSYAVFDSGYKYTYDRFNNLFRYIPCNADIAGLMVRTDIEQFPWYSPAGQARGTLNNAIKLAYNPSKAQRDTLYESRINSIINQPGSGVILFGDKTALSFASAFDRINVRRLFLTVEKALERVAQAQLFEFNDQITRANFVNVVEPYLRDVQAKRGLFDFRVICDESNNTPEVVDNNEFRADIFLKPTKSINYVTLTFVATRTGVSFEEVTGRV